jgi:hypothetical protein
MTRTSRLRLLQDRAARLRDRTPASLPTLDLRRIPKPVIDLYREILRRGAEDVHSLTDSDLEHFTAIEALARAEPPRTPEMIVPARMNAAWPRALREAYRKRFHAARPIT